MMCINLIQKANSYEIRKADYNSPPVITTMTVIYDRNMYSSDIIDFNYAGNNLNTFIKTKNRIFMNFVSKLIYPFVIVVVSCFCLFLIND